MAPPVGAAVPPAQVVADIRVWLERVVVGLNLCPFARPLQGSDRLRIAVHDQSSLAALRTAFLQELELLQGSSEQDIATTLLVLPGALEDFYDYLNFVDAAQGLLIEAGLEGVVQLASFHPHYQFAGEDSDAASHYTNRSPYPVIHLLREEMLTRVLSDGSDPNGIPARNVAALEAIGVAELERRWEHMFKHQN